MEAFDSFFDFYESDTFSLIERIDSTVNIIISSAAFIVFHFIAAKGLYTIAKRRGIPHTAFSYIPFLQFYIIGKLAEQYELAELGTTRKHTVKIIVFSAAAIVLLCLSVITGGMDALDPGSLYSVSFEGFSALYMLFGLGLAIPAIIFLIMAYNKIFKSLHPGTAKLFTILTIFASQYVASVVILINREKDHGFLELQRKYEEERQQTQYFNTYGRQ